MKASASFKQVLAGTFNIVWFNVGYDYAALNAASGSAIPATLTTLTTNRTTSLPKKK